MLLKLLKYDIKAVWKIALTVSLISFGIAAMGGASYAAYINGLANDSESPFIFVGFFGYLFSIFAISGACFTISIVVFSRFYKNLFTDEGYLTFTLPVSRNKIHLAKTLNTVIWSVYQVIMVGICFIIYSFFMPKSNIDSGINMFEFFFEPISREFAVWDVLTIIESLLTFIALALFSLCLVELCISLGAMLVKRGKLTLGIVLYMLISGAVETAGLILIILESLFFDFSHLLDTPQAWVSHAMGAGLMFVNMLLSLGVLFLTYFLTQKIIDKKLNLA